MHAEYYTLNGNHIKEEISLFSKNAFSCWLFLLSLYDWNYAGIVNPEENKENDEENDEDFVGTSSNRNECDDVTVLD